jgi:hypothetical protein
MAGRNREMLQGLVLAATASVALGFSATLGCNELTGASDVTAAGAAAGGAATSTTASSSTTSTGGATTSTSTTTSTTSSSSTTSTSTSTTTTDPWESQRQACVDGINADRATKSLYPYTRDTAGESCADAQATHDASVNIAHDASIHGTSACNAGSQNECEGYSSINWCLAGCWGESAKPECAGCDLCAGGGDCSNCVWSSCGHYLNMISESFQYVACGFSPDGSWVAMNFR